jgi:sugar phosphate isomerase/epimerase
MSLAISTSWNASSHTSGTSLIKELSHFGFRALELSFNLTAEMVEEIVPLQDEKEIEVVSVHNYCPIPDGIERKLALPDCFSLAAADGGERQRALDFTQRTINTARRLNARAVVLHTGRVEIEDRTRELIHLYNGGMQDSREYAALKKTMAGERQKDCGPFVKRVLESLDELADYAGSQGIKLGIENRYYFREIPSIDELETIFDKLKQPNLFYWHDVGHAQLYENLGLLKHTDYLNRFSDRMLGIHLHDIKGAQDHLAPLKGDFDFAKLVPYVQKDTIKVLEAHHPATAEEIEKAAEYLEGLFK